MESGDRDLLDGPDLAATAKNVATRFKGVRRTLLEVVVNLMCLLRTGGSHTQDPYVAAKVAPWLVRWVESALDWWCWFRVDHRDDGVRIPG